MKLQILQLTIVSPEHILFEGDVQLVTLPGTLGSFTVLPDHLFFREWGDNIFGRW